MDHRVVLDRGEALIQEYARVRHDAFAFRYEADVRTKVALAVAMAALTGVAAQVRVVLPFTPVPITMQTFAVLLAGVVLGKTYGGASQGLYAGLGAAGVPWFQGLGAGLGHLWGPTGGYVVGFVVAAAFVGWITDRHVRSRGLPALLVVLAVANFAIIHVLGVAWLYVWLSVIGGGSATLVEAVKLGTLPFVPGDVAKIVAAALVAKALVPARPFGPEREFAELDD